MTEQLLREFRFKKKRKLEVTIELDIKQIWIPYRKKQVGKNWLIFFAADEFFCRPFFVPTDILTDIFIHKREHLVFSNLMIPFVYLFNFKFD